LALYLRSRRVPAAVAVAVAGVAALSALARAIDEPNVPLAVVVLAAAVGAVAIGPGLAGADPDLDRTAAFPWAPRRGGHLIVAATALTGLVCAAVLTGSPLTTAGVVVRAVAGLAGLVALGAVAFGAGLAWLPPVAWTAPCVLSGALGGAWYKEVLTWMVQPWGTTSATVTAAVLGAAGTLAYAIRGSRR
jgi:hypothetical protein